MARAYLVSLPCVASVSDDGTVTLSVDPLELGNAIHESCENVTGHRRQHIAGDVVAADNAVRAGRVRVERMGR